MTWNSAPPGASSEGTMPEGLSEVRTHRTCPCHALAQTSALLLYTHYTRVMCNLDSVGGGSWANTLEVIVTLRVRSWLSSCTLNISSYLLRAS